jgi:hypothetical protein
MDESLAFFPGLVRLRSLAALLLLLVSASAARCESPYEDWYPTDIAPPAGTQYPCALTALPRELPGIPRGDRRFVNHVYSMVLKATRAKLALMAALYGNDASALEPASAAYRRTTDDVLEKIRTETVPPGLEGFAQDVTAAIELQRDAFQQAVRARGQGSPPDAVFRIPAAREASHRLLAAWSKMSLRYPDWPQPMRESVYHHLCALDLF